MHGSPNGALSLFENMYHSLGDLIYEKCSVGAPVLWLHPMFLILGSQFVITHESLRSRYYG